MSFTDLFFECQDDSTLHRIKYAGTQTSDSSEEDFTNRWPRLCDEDSDSEDEVSTKGTAVKKYLNHSLQDGIAMAINVRNRKMGIARHPGHYKLVDNCHSRSDDCSKFYQGTNWEVELPVLHRTTESLTQDTVRAAVLAEQVLRIEEEEKQIKQAMDLLKDVREELLSAIGDGQIHEKEKSEQENYVSELQKDEMLSDLVQTVHCRELRLEADVERRRQQDVLEHLARDDLPILDQGVNELLGMAEVNDRKAVVHKDIKEAFDTLEETQLQIEHEEFLLSQDLKDLAMRELTTAIVRIKVQIEVVTEYKEKMAGVRQLLRDGIYQRAAQCMEFVHEELLSDFASVQVDQNEREEILMSKVHNMRLQVLEELQRRSLTKKLDHMCAVERQDRIREAEMEQENPDLYRETVRDMMATVFEELVMKKYSGEMRVVTEYKEKMAGVRQLLRDGIYQRTAQCMEFVPEELLSDFASVQDQSTLGQNVSVWSSILTYQIKIVF